MDNNQLQKTLKQNNGIAFLPDSKTWVNRFEVESETSNRLYIIAKRANKNEWGCSCRGWIIHRNCKHLRAVMPMIEAASKQSSAPKAKPSASKKPIYKRLY